MARPSEGSPPGHHPARSGAPIQPDRRPEDEFEEAEAVDRLIADYDLVTDLAWRGFQGPEYQVFEHELARYGLAVMRAWMFRGEIVSRCHEKGVRFPAPPAGAFSNPDDVAELAGETVALALRYFRDDVLVNRRWDYRRGASLRTYFIGQCLFRFRDAYKRWRAHDRPPAQQLTDALEEDMDTVTGHRPDPTEDAGLDRVLIEHALRSVERPDVRRALVLSACGYTHPQIAAQLDTTPKTVERMIANERTRLKKRGIA